MTVPEPPVPKDGSCVVCGQPRKPERSRKYGGPVAEADPFCSTDCAREWHHNPRPAGGRPGQKIGAERTPSPVEHGTVKGFQMCACPLCVAAEQERRERMRDARLARLASRP